MGQGFALPAGFLCPLELLSKSPRSKNLIELNLG